MIYLLGDIEFEFYMGKQRKKKCGQWEFPAGPVVKTPCF